MAGTSIGLVVVDVQLDFCAGGALPVPYGDTVIAPINRLLQAAKARKRLIVVTRDWHPPDSTHFTTGGGAWPPHCVADTPGAAFHPGLRIPQTAIVVSKGRTATEDGYSGFDGTDTVGRSLRSVLQSHSLSDILVCGLATDYCVRATALDASRFGITTYVVSDAIASVELRESDGQRALEDMRTAGVGLVDTNSAQQLLEKEVGEGRTLGA
jgi:nicotinamidase/pyrazinamidase